MTDHDDVQLAYQDSCSGPTLLLIHGFPLNSTMWDAEIDELGDLVRVLAPDLRGFGHSEGSTPPYSMRMLASDCLGLLEAAGVGDEIIVAGHSMGGYIALEILRQAPERVAGLILIATRAAADSPEGQVRRDETARQVQAVGPSELFDTMAVKMLAPENAEDEELTDFLRAMMADATEQGIVGALAAMRDRPDSTSMLPQIDVPTLVIHGRDDQIVPVAEAEAVAAAIPNAQLVILDNAGHAPNLEAPDDFVVAMWNFLESVGE